MKKATTFHGKNIHTQTGGVKNFLSLVRTTESNMLIQRCRWH